EALVAGGALGQRGDERLDVTGGDPDVTVEDDGRVEADDVGALLDHPLPPLAAHVFLELDAERAVVPGGAGAAVDLTGREDKTATLREADDGIDAIGGHVVPPTPHGDWLS